MSFPSSSPATSTLKSTSTSSSRRPRKAQSLEDYLAQNPPGHVKPCDVLETLIQHCNWKHRLKNKNTASKTQAERARLVRKIFRELQTECGFKTLPDPRNFDQRHIQATLELWKRRQLQAGTLQTYFSALRALAEWVGKPGLIRPPEAYGLQAQDYARSGCAAEDRSWSAHGINISETLDAIHAYDPIVGVQLLLAQCMGLRRKEAVMFDPHAPLLRFEQTGLNDALRQADWYIEIIRGTKGGRIRYIPLTPERHLAIQQAQTLTRADGDLAHPGKSLEQSLDRFSTVMKKFGLTQKASGVTAHGLRHELLLQTFEQHAGHPAPIRGGEPLNTAREKQARKMVAILAGHNRRRASNAYCGGSQQRKEVDEGNADVVNSPVTRET